MAYDIIYMLVGEHMKRQKQYGEFSRFEDAVQKEREIKAEQGKDYKQLYVHCYCPQPEDDQNNQPVK